MYNRYKVVMSAGGDDLPFQIIRNDITKVKADAIVNTANPNVAIGGGVDSAIYKAAGREKLLLARKKIGRLEVGDVALTDAFGLDARYIIHVSGPKWNDGMSGEGECLRGCYDKALNMALYHNCLSIAFPLLATGSYGFPKELGVQIAIDSFTHFLEENEMEITLVVFGDDAVNVSGALVDEVRSYIDDDYVETTIASEYALGSMSSVDRFADVRHVPDDMKGLGGLHTSRCASKPMATESSAESLDEELKSIYTDSFEKHLRQLINKKGLKNSEVYAAANISKQYFSKIMNGQVKPSKEKMLALAVGLRLNVDETIDFLRIAGYALSPISQTDKIVEYFIRRGEYNVIKIDILLFDYGLEPLTSK